MASMGTLEQHHPADLALYYKNPRIGDVEAIASSLRVNRQYRRGELFFTEAHVGLNQKTTQTNEGGMSDVYQDLGTYRKSFYTVMIAPSCTQVRVMGRRYMRAHHHVNWRKAVPVIISGKWAKP